MGFEIGQKTGVYEFIAVQDNVRIGRSYKVRNTIADRFEVLRVLSGDPRLDREEADRFLREIKVHARLSHPNIVSFYTAMELDNHLVMTSEFFEGISLEKRLEAGPMPVREAISRMYQVLAALNYAHEHGVVHREISTANILLGADGAVKLTGFGLAKSEVDPELTIAGTVMGWLEYMSPEQVKAIAVDARADIYSAGAVLYEMVTGRVPFVCKNEFDLMTAHLSTPPAPPISVKPDLPPQLSRIILNALAKDPAERFQTAAEFREALANVALSPPPRRQDPVAPPPRDRQRLLLTGVFTFILVAAAFFALLKIVRL
jgi:eukaryotic-like serine/threonine-protein kinase